MFSSHVSNKNNEVHYGLDTPLITLIDGSHGSAKLTISAFLQAYCPTVYPAYRPSIWLPNGHLQTIYVSKGESSELNKVEYERKYIRLPDGGTLGIDFTPPFSHNLSPDTPVILVSHGVTGGSHEKYVRDILAAACAPKDRGGLGYRAAVANFRGCAGVPLTSPRLYSAAASDDLKCAALYVHSLFPRAKLVGVGFSLGANVLTRYLGEEGERSLLSSGCAMACPWNLVANSIHLENNWFNCAVYSKALGRNVLTLLRSHLPALESFPPSPGLPSLEKIFSLKNPRIIDTNAVIFSQFGGATPLWPFPSATAYHAYARSDHSLPGIRVPFLAISSKDDPMVREVPTDCGNNGWCAVVLTEGGGHLGWFEDKGGSRWKFDVQRWVRKPVLEWLKATVEDVERIDMPNVEVEVVDGFTRETGRPEIGFKEIVEEELPKYNAKAEGIIAGL